MYSFFELLNEYPWTSFFVFCGLIALINAISELIHGKSPTIIIGKDNDNKED